MQAMTISYDNFRQAMNECIRIGYMQAVKAYEPDADFVKETDVKKWLRMMGVELKTFSELVKTGGIKRKRRGTSANSPWYYSKADIISQLSITEIHKSLIQQ